MGKVDSLFLPENLNVIGKFILKLGSVIDMLSIFETYCDLRDLLIGKRVFL